MVDEGLEISEEPDQHRFVVRSDGAVAGAAYYRRRGDRLLFTHTEVSDDYAGRGVGSALARGALDTVRARGEQAVPLCPFIAGWIGKHPEYADLVDEALRRELQSRSRPPAAP